jgi:molybdenum cofactor cytidylyltransferase
MSSVEGVVLAAGLSSRAGAYKMELPLGDKTLIERSIEGMLEVASRILVVVGWKAERVRDLLAGYPQVEIVLNEAYAEGMFSSVRAGIARVRAERFFLLPGDHALVGAAVYRQLLAVPSDIAIPTYKGRKGHPILTAGRLIPDILDQPPESTLRDYVNRKGYALVEVDEEGILIDVDTPGDYDALVARYAHERNQVR